MTDETGNTKFSVKTFDSDRDLQGEGGGGKDNHSEKNGESLFGYSNPAFTGSFDSKPSETEMKRSDDFTLIDEPKRSTIKAIKTVVPWLKHRVRKACTKKMLQRRIPIINWLPRYNSQDAIGDLVAGITVGLMVIPQSLAYASIAGLPPQYGLYSSFLGCFVYILLGSCKDVPVGPTAIASILIYQVVQGRSPEYAILLSFLAGIIELIMGFFGLGFLVDFVSGPVSSGFTSAGALIIVTSQIKDVLGIKASGSTFIQTWVSLISNIHGISGWDTFLGVAAIVVLLLMRLMAKIRFGPDETTQSIPTKFQKIANQTIWMISTSRNAILVLVCGLIGYFLFNNYEEVPVKLIGEIPSGLPELKIPSFSITSGNTTTSFTEMVTTLGSGLVLVPLLALLEDIAICKAFANGKSIDATQELIAIGVSNVATSFFQGFPVTGSLSRSAVLHSSGPKTTFHGFYTGVLVITSLLFLTPYFFFIPKASLAAIIIAAVIFMVEVKVVKPMWRCKKSDFFLALATFVACLVLALEIGILVGIGMNLLFILYYAARPKITIEKLVSSNGIEYLMLTPDRCLIFPSVDYVRNLVTKHSVRQEIPVVIDCSHIYGADYTAATVIDILTKDFASRNQVLIFYNLKPSVSNVFEALSPKEFLVSYTQDDVNSLLSRKTTELKSRCNI